MEIVWDKLVIDRDKNMINLSYLHGLEHWVFLTGSDEIFNNLKRKGLVECM
jgi:hypothetical protein